MSVVIETTKGDITVDLYTAERPKACLNFLKLCKQKMYNNNLFHMIQNNFIAQTGDPSETGRGGDSIFYHLYGDQARLFEAESNPRIKHTKQGQLSMVNCGENMLGSQFFFTLSEDLDYLDGEHCVFGEVVEGFDIVEVLNETICDSDHRPYQDVRITHMVVLHDPFDDPPGLEPRPDSPEPSKELLKSSRIGADENINDYAGKTEEEINEIIAQKEANARATILEMVGDLPDADCAPPENVLFVCKLNPVTNDDDLEIIFSRFGKVKCCEVIRDKKSGESLQYAFVEFEDENACESAYFKMDNVLIDDRRIHVDFSQSVSKFQWKGKGRLEVKDEKESKKPNVVEKNKGFKSNKDRDFNNRQKDKETDLKRNRNENDRDRYEKRDDIHRHRDDREEGRTHSKNGHDKDRRDNKDRRDERDNKDRRDERDNRDNRDERDNRDKRDERDTKDRRDERDTKDRTDERVDRDKRDERNQKYRREERDNRDRKDESVNRDRKVERENRDRKDESVNRDRKVERENRDKRNERKDDKRKERSNENSARDDYKNSTNGSRDKLDDRRHNTSKYDQRSENGERKMDYRHTKEEDRDKVRNKDERLEKRKYPEERSKTKEKRDAGKQDKKKSKYSSSDASSSETDNKRHPKKAKKKSKRSKSDSSSSDSSSSESD